MQLFNQLSPKTARQTGTVLFVVSCGAFVAGLSLPFIPLPVSGPVKAGLVAAVFVVSEATFAASLALLGKEFVNRIKSFVSFPTASFSSFFVGAGIAVWAVATVLLRVMGQYLLIPGQTYLTVGAFAGVAVLMVVLMSVLYRVKHVRGSERVLAATLFAVSGILLDAGTVFFFTDVFPNMLPTANGLFAAWLFWGYGVVLLTGLVWPAEQNEPT